MDRFFNLFILPTLAENSFNLAKHCSPCMIISFCKSSCLLDLNAPIHENNV